MLIVSLSHGAFYFCPSTNNRQWITQCSSAAFVFCCIYVMTVCLLLIRFSNILCKGVCHDEWEACCGLHVNLVNEG